MRTSASVARDPAAIESSSSASKVCLSIFRSRTLTLLRPPSQRSLSPTRTRSPKRRTVAAAVGTAPTEGAVDRAVWQPLARLNKKRFLATARAEFESRYAQAVALGDEGGDVDASVMVAASGATAIHEYLCEGEA